MGKIRLTGATSGYTELQAASAAGNNTITLPTTDGGQVIVSDSSGNVNIDSGTFYVDASNNRVGIGTTSPGSFGYFAVRGFAALGGSYGNVSAHFSDGVTNSLFIKHAAGEIGHFTDGATAQSFYTNSTERARIDSSGRLLVGTSTARSNFNNTTDTTRLQIEGTDAATSSLSLVCNNGGGVPVASIHLAKSDGASIGSTGAVANNWDLGDIRFSGSDGTEFVQAASIACEVDGTPGTNDMPGRLVFSTTADGASSPTERMRILNNGTTDLRAATDVINILSNAAAGTTNLLIRGGNSATSFTAYTIPFGVYTNGNVVNTNNSYGAISDIKLKENIVDANSQWDDIKALQVRNYNFKEGQVHTQIGLVAQEAELVSPGLVSESPDRDEDGNDLGTVTKSVNYSVLYMKAVKALQEAMERIETLEAKVATLEAS
jgi:hypothetical protein